MALPTVVSRDEWLAARMELLAEEKAMTRARDALNTRRRELPMVRVDKEYLFDGPDGSPVIHNLPMYRSTGLTTWQYAGDAFTDKPSWVAPAACGRPT